MIFSKPFPYQQQGVILIIVLWFVVIITVMIAALASETRLSAKIVFHNKENLYQWADILKAWRIAEMELMLANMSIAPDDKERQEFLREGKNWNNRFDGRVLDTGYTLPENITVRIYDSAGKINIQLLTKQRMQELLEKHIGNDLEKLQTLDDIWQDWLDRDELKRQNGAEKEYYEKLTPPYQPRNGRLETVEELRLLKGFDEIFATVDINNTFTVFGNTWQINPNLATREALLALPGMNEKMADAILVRRREEEFKNIGEFNELDAFKEMEFEQRNKFIIWMTFATSNFYTIAIQVKNPQTDEEQLAASESTEKKMVEEIEEQKPYQPEYGYLITVQFMGIHQPPKVLMVNPYGILPDTRH